MTAPSSWPFPKWVCRNGRWQMVRQRLPKPDPTENAEPNLL